MAPSTEPEENPYELLGLSQEATDAEIRTAYRTRSLKVHPDRNRNDPHAAQKFHALTTASTLLLDPLRRMALDAQLRLAAAKKARFSAYDNKRKALVTELEERERAFKKSRLEREQQKVARDAENDRIKEEGRRMREEREKALASRAEGKAGMKMEEGISTENAPPSLGPYDTTVRVRYSLSTLPLLNTAAALVSSLRQYGEIDEGAVVLSIKPKKVSKKKPQNGAVDTQGKEQKVVNAVVPFAQISAAFAVISSALTLKEQGIEVSWAGGCEPPILGWLRDKGELDGRLKGDNKLSAIPLSGTPGRSEAEGDPVDGPRTTAFSTFPSIFPASLPQEPAKPTPANTLDFESLTLLRLREAERARLEREILEAEARGEA